MQEDIGCGSGSERSTLHGTNVNKKKMLLLQKQKKEEHHNDDDDVTAEFLLQEGASHQQGQVRLR